MCFGCYEHFRDDFGLVPVTDEILAAAKLADQANSFGPMHIAIDDWNLDDDHMVSCREWLEEGEWDGTATSVDRDCWVAFNALTYEGRNMALAISHGYVDKQGKEIPA